MRLFPSVPGFGRKLTEDCKFGEKAAVRGKIILIFSGQNFEIMMKQAVFKDTNLQLIYIKQAVHWQSYFVLYGLKFVCFRFFFNEQTRHMVYVPALICGPLSPPQ